MRSGPLSLRRFQLYLSPRIIKTSRFSFYRCKYCTSDVNSCGISENDIIISLNANKTKTIVRMDVQTNMQSLRCTTVYITWHIIQWMKCLLVEVVHSANSSNELPNIPTTQTRANEVHASVVTEWPPAFLQKLPPRKHQRGNWRKPRKKRFPT